jgi:hypothetical protein
LFDPAGEYFCRAQWGAGNASRPEVRPEFKSYLTAFAIHACDALIEEFNRIIAEPGCDPEAIRIVKALPHIELITNLRNHDLHGDPLPVCASNFLFRYMKTHPDESINSSSSNGVGIALTMDGNKPKVIRSPNIRKYANVEFGGKTISCSCVNGQLIAYDFSTTKDIPVLQAVGEFLQACNPLFNPPAQTTDEEN